MTTPAPDATTFGSIQALLQQQALAPLAVGQPALGMECGFGRRTSNRRPYACPQLLAPYDGQSLPSQASFRLVDCQDISPDGFSFLSASEPEGRYVIIALGQVPFSFFSAEIVRVERLAGPMDEQLRVHCRFLRCIGRQGSA